VRLKDFIHLDEILVSSKPLTRFVGPRLIPQENLTKKVACPICGEIYEKTEIFFRSKELMDKAILLESKVKP
jgi:hypothetical protein